MDKSKINVLVLGANGFIGSQLTMRLIDEGYTVRAFDRFKEETTINIARDLESFEVFQGDFLNQSDMENALDGIDYVFHLVSMTTPASSKNDPLIDIDTNTRGTVSMLQLCAAKGIKKVFFASSGGAIYGNQVKEKFSEDDLTNPISPYAIAKLTIEKYLEYFYITHHLDYTILRYANPYGPGQRCTGDQGIIPIFLKLISSNEPITVYGTGSAIRDYIYIDDLIDASVKIFQSDTEKKLFNIGSSEGVSIMQLTQVMKEVVQKEVEINFLPQREIDVSSVVLNTERIKKIIGDIKKTDLHKGISLTWHSIVK